MNARLRRSCRGSASGASIHSASRCRSVRGRTAGAGTGVLILLVVVGFAFTSAANLRDRLPKAIQMGIDAQRLLITFQRPLHLAQVQEAMAHARPGAEVTRHAI